jgi:hypothetical protein
MVPLLFGTGNLSLRDTEEKEKIQPKSSNPTTAVSYGSTDVPAEATQPHFASPEQPSAADNSVITTLSWSSKQSAAASVNSTIKPERPQRKFLLDAFFFIEGCGVLTSFTLMLTQLIPLFFLPVHELGVVSLLLKVYISLFCLLFIMLEWDFPMSFLKKSRFLQTYFSRGFLYSFLGLTCFEQAYSERVKDMVAHAKDQFHVAWISLFMQVSSWMMLVLGVVYMFLGLCCLKKVRDKMKQEHRLSWANYREAMKIYRDYKPE